MGDIHRLSQGNKSLENVLRQALEQFVGRLLHELSTLQESESGFPIATIAKVKMGEYAYLLSRIRSGPWEHLSPREREVGNLVFEGLTNKGIAFRLKIEPSTVADLLHRAYGKLNIDSRVAFALLSLIDPGNRSFMLYE